MPALSGGAIAAMPRPLAGLPRGQGKIEFGLDLVGGAHVDRAHRNQRLRDQRQAADMARTQGAGRGRAAQFGLGQLPQMGFRVFGVHVLLAGKAIEPTVTMIA